MSTKPNRFDPSFSLFPIQNNRSGFKDVSLPIVLVAPWIRDHNGVCIDNSSVFNVTYFIEDVPDPAKVAGVEHRGIFVPDRVRYTISLTDGQVISAKIDLAGLDFIDQTTGDIKTYSQAVEGDLIKYTTLSGVIDTIIYYPDANYYDFSHIEMDIDGLPYNDYYFVWQASYYNRVNTKDNEFYCIDDTAEVIARFRISYKHPGDVHRNLIEQTPSFYFENRTLAEDETVKFYRMFADVLQDVFDEQTLIRGINWLTQIPAQFMPYLSYLIGWDLPYYPGASDNVRRAVLRNARKLQSYKGSKRAIRELFDILGYSVDIINLWYNTEKDELIAPDETLDVEHKSQEIVTRSVCQAEPLVNQYTIDGWGEMTIPLLYRPNNNLVIYAWLSNTSSSISSALISKINSTFGYPDILEDNTCVTDDGYYDSRPLSASLPHDYDGYARVLIDQQTGRGIKDDQYGDAPISKENITFDRYKNEISIKLSHFIEYDNQELFIFVVYPTTKILVPDKIKDLRSNRFDIRILDILSDDLSSKIYDFLLNFIFKLKAFHSLLRKIQYTINFDEVYNVTNLCVCYDYLQCPEGDLGNFQVPPAITPLIPGVDVPWCSEEAVTRGFKDIDFKYRERVLAGLRKEHALWKRLDGTHDASSVSGGDITYNRPQSLPCQYNKYGQNALEWTDKDLDHNIDDRNRICDIDKPTKDFCFNGRVNQNVDTDTIIPLEETRRCSPCALMAGTGTYWIQNSMPFIASTGSLDFDDESGRFLGYLNRKLYNADFNNTSLFYTNRPYLEDYQQSLGSLSLNIQKENLHFPGHRFPWMDKLEVDYIATDWRLKPWDDFTDGCFNSHEEFLENMHAELIDGTDGDQYLTYDDLSLVYEGNGLVPDISGLDVQHDTKMITHDIYSHVALRAWETYDGITPTDETALCLDTESIFTSSNEDCECDTDTLILTYSEGNRVDYIDGYPSVIGPFTYNINDYNYHRSSGWVYDWHVLFPDLPGPTGDKISTYKCGSGIRVFKNDLYYSRYKGYRADCGCMYYSCDGSTGSQSTIDRCQIDWFENDDYHCDKIKIESTLVLPESLGVCSTVLDATIMNLFTIHDGIIEVTDDRFPPEGHILYRDAYGIIYEVYFEIYENRLDITTIKKDPHVWGEPDQGYRDGFDIYRRGVITTTRQIIEVDESGYIVISEGCTQIISFIKTTFICETAPSDEFLYHLNCQVTDDLEMIVGPGTGSVI